VGNVLLGWCVFSLFGTLLALRLIRNGKSNQRPVEPMDNAETNAPPQAGINRLPDAHGIQHRAEHSR
jgi:hypothetical protein